LEDLDNFYLRHDEPIKSCLQAMRTFILNHDHNITEAWKYRMPVFCYKGKMFCYLWVHKKNGLPYLGIVEGRRIDHPKLIQENRSRMKIMILDPTKDLPVRTIGAIFKMAKTYYL
jgi:Domain of unknown function (DU1801)